MKEANFRFIKCNIRAIAAIMCVAMLFAFSSTAFAKKTKDELVAEGFAYVDLGVHEGFDKDHLRLCEKNPDVLSLTLSTPNTSYRIGEVIPLTLKFSNSSDINYSVYYSHGDRSGRDRGIVFHVDGPAGGFIDSMATHAWCMGGGLMGDDHKLGEYWLKLELNQWVRFDKPGKYRLYCMTSNITERHGEGQDRIDLVSSIAEITILPADEAMAVEIIAKCKKGLKSDKKEQRIEALRRLWYLGTDEALEFMIPYLCDEENNVRFWTDKGIIGLRNRQYAFETLLDKMDDPDVAVNSTFISTLVTLAIPYEDFMRYLDLCRELEERIQVKEELWAKYDELEQKYLQKLLPMCQKKTGGAYKTTCALLISEGFTVEGAPKELVEKYKPKPEKVLPPRPLTPMEKLEKFVQIDPLKNKYGREVKDVPEEIAGIVESFNQRGMNMNSYFPYLVEYALNLHLNFLEQTWLARELPVEDNILLVEFVRLSGLPKYKTAYEAGWLCSQFLGEFNGRGYSSFQVYIWYLECKSRVDRYPNSKRIHEIGDKIKKTGIHGIGGGEVCHYGCR